MPKLFKSSSIFRFTLYFTFSIVFAPPSIFGQEFILLDSSQRQASFRGLSMPSNEIAWVSGSKGTVGKSRDAGKTWEWVNPPGYENRDFRDIEAFDAQTALVLAVDNPAVILRTTDGGKNWARVFFKDQEGMFLDAMDFAGKRGYAIGDPLKDRFYMLYSKNHGRTWKEVPFNNRPQPQPGDAIFAASGSNILLTSRTVTGAKAAFATGGHQNKIWLLKGCLKKPGVKQTIRIPMMRGKNTTGINGMAVKDDFFFVTGGDFAVPQRPDSNFFVINTDLDRVRILPSFEGYKSGVAVSSDYRIIVCGTSGIAFGVPRKDENGLRHFGFRDFSQMPFHVVTMAPDEKYALLAGPAGRIAIVKW